MAVVHDQLLMNHFAKPDGILGDIVGNYMATEYLEVNLWAVQMLEIQPNDNILEVGFGPGTAIEEIAKLAPEGHIAGIDYSELMLARAKKRNQQAIQRGHVDLRHANVSELPAFEESFDKIIAINNVMYWPNLVESLQGLRNTLKPGGTIQIILQRGYEQAQKGECNDEINWYSWHLQEAGFADVGACIQPVTLVRKLYGAYDLAGICIRGFNPALCQRAK